MSDAPEAATPITFSESCRCGHNFGKHNQDGSCSKCDDNPGYECPGYVAAPLATPEATM